MKSRSSKFCASITCARASSSVFLATRVLQWSRNTCASCRVWEQMTYQYQISVLPELCILCRCRALRTKALGDCFKIYDRLETWNWPDGLLPDVLWCPPSLPDAQTVRSPAKMSRVNTFREPALAVSCVADYSISLLHTCWWIKGIYLLSQFLQLIQHNSRRQA